MSRTPIVAGNWKMNTTLPEATALAKEVARAVPEGVEVVLCPPFVSLEAVREAVSGTPVMVGAQNMYHQEKGAFTGEISPLMLKGLAEYVILGHSERRQYFGEEDELVNRKVLAALAHGLRPILCVGEKLEERQAGRACEVVERQLRGALQTVPWSEGLVIAYEPVWAIGTGVAATPQDADEIMGRIRSLLTEMYGSAGAGVRLQYGGSVSPENFPGFIERDNIDGALVGGASLNAESFCQILRQAASAKG